MSNFDKFACAIYAICLVICINCMIDICYKSPEPPETKIVCAPCNLMVEEKEPLEPNLSIPKALEEMKKPEPKPIYTRTEPVEMLCKTSAKTYMDYRSITDQSSNQYRFIYSDITICEDGFLRDCDGYIGVAMGSYFGEIGSRYICRLDTGRIIKVVKVESKSDKHAVKGFCGSTNYDIIEFVIDSHAEWMQANKWENGLVFSGNFNNYEPFDGTIIEIERVL